MVLPDVNVLVYAHREDTAHHAGCREWVEKVINGEASYGPDCAAEFAGHGHDAHRPGQTERAGNRYRRRRRFAFSTRA